jgi:thiol-disulfide isomerase/thioredoxin
MFGLFAVFCLNAATLIDVKDPAKIAAAFAPRSELRVMNVWATWCVPCVEEMNDLAAISKQFPQISMIGVSLDDMVPDDRTKTKQKVRAFLDQKQIAYRNVYYSGNSDALANTLRFSGEIPITIIYDRSGREVWRQQGKIDRQRTIAEIRKLLRRKQ